MVTELVRLVDPEIMELRASVVTNVEEHIHWSIGYAPEVDENGERFVVAHLHAVGDDGFVEVEIAATQRGGAFGDLAEGAAAFEAALAGSESLGTIYNFARTAARSLSATIDCDIALPPIAPEVEVARLVRADSPPSESVTTETTR